MPISKSNKTAKSAKTAKSKTTKAGASSKKRGRGRPTVFSDKIKKQIKVLVLEGLKDKTIAQGIGVTEQTFCNWKKQHPDFFEQLKDWKRIADHEIERSLRARALGYTDPNGKHYPPDPTSMIFWLKNRQPDQWREKKEVTVLGIESLINDIQERSSVGNDNNNNGNGNNNKKDSGK